MREVPGERRVSGMQWLRRGSRSAFGEALAVRMVAGGAIEPAIGESRGGPLFSAEHLRPDSWGICSIGG
jgi:hypothetical protein